jgi:hypothetical protein
MGCTITERFCQYNMPEGCSLHANHYCPFNPAAFDDPNRERLLSDEFGGRRYGGREDPDRKGDGVLKYATANRGRKISPIIRPSDGPGYRSTENQTSKH